MIARFDSSCTPICSKWKRCTKTLLYVVSVLSTASAHIQVPKTTFGGKSVRAIKDADFVIVPDTAMQNRNAADGSSSKITASSSFWAAIESKSLLLLSRQVGVDDTRTLPVKSGNSGPNNAARWDLGDCYFFYFAASSIHKNDPMRSWESICRYCAKHVSIQCLILFPSLKLNHQSPRPSNVDYWADLYESSGTHVVKRDGLPDLNDVRITGSSGSSGMLKSKYINENGFSTSFKAQTVQSKAMRIHPSRRAKPLKQRPNRQNLPSCSLRSVIVLDLNAFINRRMSFL